MVVDRGGLGPWGLGQCDGISSSIPALVGAEEARSPLHPTIIPAQEVLHKSDTNLLQVQHNIPTSLMRVLCKSHPAPPLAMAQPCLNMAIPCIEAD